MSIRPAAYIALLSAWCLFGLCCGTEAQTQDPASSPPPVSDTSRIQAVTLDARRPPSDATLQRIRDLGATHIALVSFGFQRESNVPTIRMHTEGGWYSESDRGIRALARQVDSLGMGLILKPHIWVGHYSADGQDRHEISFDTEAQWDQWMTQYRRFLMHYAHLSEEVDADLLVIGTELKGVVRAQPDFWRALIREIRSVYSGKLTYAANWYEAYKEVPFWDALDYVGVQAYFPLSEAEDPSLATLREGWAAYRAELKQVHEQTGRPILFTELGYRSVGYAAATPWKWPERDEQATPAPKLQARLYQAFFNEVMPAPWFGGAILWKWYPAGEAHRPLGFTPQNKPAERILQQGFAGSSP